MGDRAVGVSGERGAVGVSGERGAVGVSGEWGVGEKAESALPFCWRVLTKSEARGARRTARGVEEEEKVGDRTEADLGCCCCCC